MAGAVSMALVVRPVQFIRFGLRITWKYFPLGNRWLEEEATNHDNGGI